MTVANLKRMMADEYVLWAQRQKSGRFELVDGVVVEMNAETSAHGRVKLNIAMALKQWLKTSGIAGDVFGDGMAVRISERVVHEPDAVVRFGAPLSDDAVVIVDPVVVVEVLSPSTGPIDTGLKLANYFSLASVQHYLVINTVKRVVQHYVRDSDGRPVMRPLISAGTVELVPPGIALDVEAIFER